MQDGFFGIFGWYIFPHCNSQCERIEEQKIELPDIRHCLKKQKFFKRHDKKRGETVLLGISTEVLMFHRPQNGIYLDREPDDDPKIVDISFGECKASEHDTGIREKGSS